MLGGLEGCIADLVDRGYAYSEAEQVCVAAMRKAQEMREQRPPEEVPGSLRHSFSSAGEALGSSGLYPGDSTFPGPSVYPS